jgi:hypothetical protein
MPDVFISYARPDRPIAEALAADFMGRSQTVWWDADLYAGDNFHHEITKALDSCTAVVVVWSAHAAKSIWVCAEAMRAIRHNKLVATRLPEVAIDELPLPFDQFSMALVTDRDAIYRSVDRILRPPERIEMRVDIREMDPALGGYSASAKRPTTPIVLLDLRKYTPFAERVLTNLGNEDFFPSDPEVFVEITKAPIDDSRYFPAEHIIDIVTRIHSKLTDPSDRLIAECIIADVIRVEAAEVFF